MSTPTVIDPGDAANVTIRRSLRASASRIWAACTDPRELSRWQTDRADGVAEAGRHFVLRWPALGIVAEVGVLEVDTGRRLVLRHGHTDVTFSVYDGALEVAHTSLPDAETAQGVASSWRLSLGVLAHYLEHHDGADRHVSWHVAEATTTPAAAHVYFTDPQALSTWLTRSGGIGEANQDVRLELAWRSRGGDAPAPLTGSVLANTPGRDVALSWREQDQSVIALRTLPAATSEGRVLALSWSRWGEQPARPSRDHEAVDDQLAAALGRLERLLGAAGSA